MPIMQSPPGAITTIDGKDYLYFAGTSYYCFHGHPEVLRAAKAAMDQYGLNSATSRTMYGNSPPTLEAEKIAAEYFGTESAFYFASGYVGNTILLKAMEKMFDRIFLDEAAHYSATEAASATGKPMHTFGHCDANDLAKALQENCLEGERPIVMSDGIFAAKGTIVPLAEHLSVLKQYPGSAIFIDDAHGLGTLGANGRGSIDHAGLWDLGCNKTLPEDVEETSETRIYMCGTLSKAFGGYGGIIPGSNNFINYLRKTSRFFSGASAPPVPTAAAAGKAMQMLMNDPSHRNNLQKNIAYLRSRLKNAGLNVAETASPVIHLSIGTREKMQAIANQLKEDGIIIVFTNYAGMGPEGGLRIAVFSTHTQEMIDKLVSSLGKLAYE